MFLSADERFSRCMDNTLAYEGGKSNHPKDPGGKTNQGVIQRTFTAWLKANSRPDRDVYTMTVAERDAIYRSQYWNAVRGDELPDGVDLAVFDGAVNSGPKQSIKWLQRALQAIGLYVGSKVDGVMGNATMAAIKAVKDYDALVARMIAARRGFLKALKTWDTFKRGWTKRVDQVLAKAQAWATGSVGPEPVYVPGAEAKAPIEDAKPIPKTVAADAAIGAGVAAAGSSAINSVGTMNPTAIVAVVVASIVLIAGGIAWRLYTSDKAAKLLEALDPDVAGEAVPA